MIVQVKNISKKFSLKASEFYAVNNVSFNIEKGKTYGLVGESACGKTTVALSILALQPIDAGEIIFDGTNILKLNKKHLRTLRRNMRLLFQNPETVLNSSMTIHQMLREELEKLKEKSKTEKENIIRKTMLRVGLKENILSRYPPGLSTGEKQRAAIARAIITKPKFLVCDEPVASLDLSLKSSIIDLLMTLQERLGLTYLYISHNLALVSRIAHKIGIMYMGFLVEEAPAETFDVHKVLHPYSTLLLASVPSSYTDEEYKELAKTKSGEKNDQTKLLLNLSRRYQNILKDYPDTEPVRMPNGCPFQNRCPFYSQNPLKECETIVPELRDHGDGRKVACHQITGLVYRGMRTAAV